MLILNVVKAQPVMLVVRDSIGNRYNSIREVLVLIDSIYSQCKLANVQQPALKKKTFCLPCFIFFYFFPPSPGQII